jgi:Ca2+-binding EF-hand superfamily protein
MKDVVAQVDKNNDGKVSYDEFKLMMKSTAE